jgi:hypothetical protein
LHFLGLRIREGPPSLYLGRYIDRFQKPGGNRAIAHLVCINEKVRHFAVAEVPDKWHKALISNGPSTQCRDDVSYARPLRSGNQNEEMEGKLS